MNLIIEDLKKTPILFIGFLVMSIGIVLIRISDLGLFPWGVLHDGMSQVLPLTFGQITSYFGFVILLFSVVFFKTNVGPGTFLNILLVGPIIDTLEKILTFSSNSLLINVLFFMTGLVLMALGKAVYISTKLGAGPRDGLFVGVSRVFQVEVKYVKPIIEIIVLVIGYFLGGVVGVGTIITMTVSGYIIQQFFSILHFDSKIDRQRNFIDYFKDEEVYE